MAKIKIRINREKQLTSNQQLSDDIIPIQSTTELGDSLKELNKDDIDLTSRTSDIDLRARLHYLEISSILALDALVAFGICPTRCLAFTRQKKRLSVSLMGQGRKEIVDVVAGKRELETNQGMSFMQKLTSGFKKENNG